MFKDVVWEQSQGKAIANLSDTQTLKVSMGGCLRCNWAVSFETSESIGLEDLNFWNKTTNWIFEKVFTDEKVMAAVDAQTAANAAADEAAGR